MVKWLILLVRGFAPCGWGLFLGGGGVNSGKGWTYGRAALLVAGICGDVGCEVVVRYFLLAVAVGVAGGCWGCAGTSGGRVAATMPTEVRGENGAAEAIRAYDEAVARLIKRVEATPVTGRQMGSEYHSDDWSDAVEALGHLRAKAAVGVLVERIDWTAPSTGEGTAQRFVVYRSRHHQIVERALVEIGLPAVEPTFAHYVRTKNDPLEHMRVILNGLGDREAALAWLRVREGSQVAEERAAATALRELVESEEKARKLLPDWNKRLE